MEQARDVGYCVIAEEGNDLSKRDCLLHGISDHILLFFIVFGNLRSSQRLETCLWFRLPGELTVHGLGCGKRLAFERRLALKGVTSKDRGVQLKPIARNSQ